MDKHTKIILNQRCKNNTRHCAMDTRMVHLWKKYLCLVCIDQVLVGSIDNWGTKKGKKDKDFLELLFTHNIYMKQT
jgi:hypothetical protein